MSTTLHLVLPCRKCQTPTAHRDSATHYFPFCEKCDEKAVEGYWDQRAQFEALLEQGVERRMANRIMIQRQKVLRAK